MTVYVLDKEGNIVGEEENASYQVTKCFCQVYLRFPIFCLFQLVGP